MISVPQPEPLATMPSRSAGTTVRSVAVYSALLSAMMLISMMIFAPAVLFDCASRNGRRAALLVLTVAMAVVAAVLVQASYRPPIGPHDLALNLGIGLKMLLTFGVPALIVLPMVQHGETFGRVLMTATLAAALGMGVTEGVVRATAGVSMYEAEYNVARDNSVQFVKTSEKTMPPDGLRLLRRIVDAMLYCFAAVQLITIVTSFLLSLVLFGRLKAWRELVATRSPDVTPAYLYRNLALPEWLLFVFVIAGLSPLATGLVRHAGINAIAVVGFLYLLQGLAIYRWLLLAVGINFLGAIFAYIALALLAPVAPLLLSIAGLFDSFFDFRHFNRKDSTHEGHSD
jgi:hypothetical protein